MRRLVVLDKRGSRWYVIVHSSVNRIVYGREGDRYEPFQSWSDAWYWAWDTIRAYRKNFVHS